MKRAVYLIVFLCIYNYLHAAVDTVKIYSNSMFKYVSCVVVTPSAYTNSGKAYPVVYLLHGYSGNYSDWVKKGPDMQQLANQYNLVIVLPDGAYNSWYFDSPVNLTMRYETNISSEIPAYIDSVYHTIQSRTGRAITGLSMGGHGGIFIGFRHADRFGACGSMSGALDVSRLKSRYDLTDILGDSIVNQQYYHDFSVLHQVDNYPKDSLAMIIDCGVHDFFLEDNRRVHARLLENHIPHDYTERPGKHDWEYWKNAVKFQLLFFSLYFQSHN